jgi:hypothetical protein
MNDQNGGPNESGETHIKPEVHDADVKPDLVNVDAPLSGRTRTPPVIEGVAIESHPEPEIVTPHEGHFDTPPEAHSETPHEPSSETPHEAHETLSEAPLEPLSETEHDALSEAKAEAESETPVPESESEPAPDLTAEAASHEAPAEEALETDPPEPDESPATEPQAEKPRKSSSLVVAAAAGVVALGAGGYYGWTEFVSPAEQNALRTEASKLVGMKPQQTQPESTQPPAATSQDTAAQEAKTAPEAQPPATAPAVVEPPKAEEAPAPVAPPAEPVTKAEAPPEPSVSAPEPKIAEPAEAPAPVVAPAPAEPPAEPVRAAAADPAAEKLAQVTAQLAATQSALAQVTQRLQSVEGKLTAPKTDNRAELEARASGVSRANDASARVILAQSLLTALRQGDDFSAQLTGLQGFDGDSPRIVSLRQALGAPSAAKLAADFAALAPKLAAAAAPQPQATTKAPDAKTQDAAAPRNLAASILTFLQVRAEKLVKIRPVDAPEGDGETGARLKRIEADLRRGDVSAALEERSRLPEPAVVLSADWAKGAQARLDAELAAKAELSEALQALSKSRT